MRAVRSCFRLFVVGIRMGQLIVERADWKIREHRFVAK